MKKSNRALSLLLVIVMIIGMLSGLTASAAKVNTAVRHTLATSLSNQAKAYYTGSYTYDVMSKLSGDSTGSCLTAENSALFKSLNTLMTNTMTDSVSYSSLTGYWETTDASGGSSDACLFYSDTISSNYNREHVWPKSRASFYQSGGGSDLHHLRPTNDVINSTRGNHTMGNVRTNGITYSTKDYNGKTVLYYNAGYSGNGCQGLVEVNDNIKGDVARVLLYVYTRWEERNLFENDPNPKQQSGDSGGNNGYKVIESLETLLQWCEMDPVDEWEMMRNDLCQDVQGNRNVFIDYPEYAWLLFGEDIPADMDTPSGEAKNGTPACTHEGTVVTDAAVAATCTETGLTEGSHCSNCGATLVAQTVTAATGHSYVVSGELAPTENTDGYIAYTCSVCGDSYTQIVSALPCTHTGTIVTDAAVAATCTETGLTEGSHCSNCNAVLVAQAVIPATGHSYVGVETLAPTATVDGIMTYTCANCNDAYTETIPALGGEHVCPADAFSDLDKNSWYHEGVDYMLDGGYMNGVSSNRFDPNGNITRGMIVTVLWRLEGSPAAEASPFTDVPAGKYYTTAIAWAQKNAIVNGTSATTFAPDDFVTREQIAAILYRYNNSPAVSGSLAAYPDAGSVSTCAISAITWATANGVINGSDGKLLPQDNATRAQFATMLFRAENLS